MWGVTVRNRTQEREWGVPLSKEALLRIKLSQINEIQELRNLGYSQRKVASPLKLNRRTVSKYWEADPTQVCQRKETRHRVKKLTPITETVNALYVKHRNCDVVRQLEKEDLFPPALRTIQELVQPLKRKLEIAVMVWVVQIGTNTSRMSPTVIALMLMLPRRGSTCRARKFDVA